VVERNCTPVYSIHNNKSLEEKTYFLIYSIVQAGC
jgi:hypothetical protein